MRFQHEYYPGGVGLKDFSGFNGAPPTKVYTGEDAYLKTHGFTDDWYWQAIEKYKDNPEAYAYLSSNPHLFANNAAFSPTAWQQVLEGLGDTSAKDAYYGGLLNNSRQFLNDWEKKMYEQHYDSPSEQVAREKAAGLNPDLAPGSINPGSASENDQAFTPYSMPGAGENNPIEVVSLGSTILQGAFNIFSSLNSLHSATLDTQMKQLALNSHYRDTAWDLIKAGIGDFVEGHSQFIDEKSGVIDPSFIVSVTKYFQDRLDNLPYSHSERRKLRSFTDSLIKGKDEGGVHSFNNAFQQLVSESLGSLSKSRADAVEQSGRIGSDQELNSALRFVAKEIYRPLNNLQLKVNKLVLNNSRLYQESFQSVDPDTGMTGPAMTAASDKAGAALKMGFRDIKKDIMESFQKINEAITGSKHLSPFWKIALQGGVSYAEASALQKFMNL